MKAPRALVLLALLAMAGTAWPEGGRSAPQAAAPPPAPLPESPAPGGSQAGETPAVEESPEVAVIDDLAFHYGPVVFDHGLHASMSEIAGDCANCHHETEPGEPITGCRSCHTVARSLDELTRPSLKGAFHRQCLACHKDWSHSNACGFCHLEVGASDSTQSALPVGDLLELPPAHISPQPFYTYQTTREPVPVVTFHHDDHVEVFGLTCAECHENDSCDRCHGAGGARQVINREESCMPCHSQSECVQCHNPVEQGRFNHATATDWSILPSHESVKCADCHGPGRGAAYDQPGLLRCLACHEDAHGKGLDHGAAKIPLFGSHAFLECTACHHGGSAGSVTTCTDCHEEMSYPDYVPGLASVRALE